LFFAAKDQNCPLKMKQVFSVRAANEVSLQWQNSRLLTAASSQATAVDN
jgi:hypothetical protein